MELTISVFFSAIAQVILIILVPYLWWAVSARKRKVKFFDWIGLKKVNKENIKRVYKPLIIGAILFDGIFMYISIVLKSVDTATAKFDGLGVTGIIPALIYAIIQTSLSEELFFRGFILKRVSNKFGFYAGNTVQSILFGLLHGVMFMNLDSVLNVLLITVATGAIAFLMGYINEKKADGSIIPSWIVHATANIVASFSALFMIV